MRLGRLNRGNVKARVNRKTTATKSKKKTKLEELLEIKGIGVETLKDIKRAYNSISELKKDLRNDKVPLRNDVVRKLKKFLKIR
ncbi:hypothetical protein DRN69_07275 [Candidatus Pacearchaeota archaeon]|nr:MAG: hypothetical protein DRN69_07275 [Candidatus Pacearchaeota archaeon]